MEFFFVFSIKYEGTYPKEDLEKVALIFDKKKNANLSSDDFITNFSGTLTEKSVALNLNYRSKDFATAIYEVLTKTQKFSTIWISRGPIRLKKSMYSLYIDRKTNPELPKGISS